MYRQDSVLHPVRHPYEAPGPPFGHQLLYSNLFYNTAWREGAWHQAVAAAWNSGIVVVQQQMGTATTKCPENLDSELQSR